MARVKYPEVGAFIEVKWDDAASSHKWCGVEDLPRIVVVVSRGWLVAADKKSVTLSASHTDHDEPDYGETITIPKRCINSVEVL